MEGNYFFRNKAKNEIKPELLEKDAQKLARKFIYYFDKKEQREKRRPVNRTHYAPMLLSSSQLRRFFNEVKYLNSQCKSKGFDAVSPMIKMLKAKAAYSANPQNQKIPEDFQDFLGNCTTEVGDEQDLNAFVLHFEAVVGYYYGEGIRP